MRQIGIDICSRSIEIVILENGIMVDCMLAETGHDPMAEVQRLINETETHRIMATGYGRHLLEVQWNTPTVTEIKAYARGVCHLHPEARTILDIGGQDTKTIALLPDGRIRKFEMNDRCAAGTGKFLELMASVLGYDLEQLGVQALSAAEAVQISSMCTVFAESEVISLITAGHSRTAIARGVHQSVVNRVATMLRRINWEAPLIFAGGVAKNPCMVKTIETRLECQVVVPENPQFIGALGAALLVGC